MADLDEIYMTDLAFLNGDYVATPAGDWDTISGLDNLEQALFRRLITYPGSLAHRPTYGCGIKRFQNSINSLSTQREIALIINQQFPLDPRVEEITGIQIDGEDTKPDTIKILVRVKPVGYESQVFEFIPFGEVA